MSDAERPSKLRVVIGTLVFLGIIVGPFLVTGKMDELLYTIVWIPLLLSPFGPVIGAWLVWKTVRWINDRDDPKLAKRPADTCE